VRPGALTKLEAATTTRTTATTTTTTTTATTKTLLYAFVHNIVKLAMRQGPESKFLLGAAIQHFGTLNSLSGCGGCARA